MSDDKHRLTQLRGMIVSLAKGHWKPTRAMVSPDGRTVPPTRANYATLDIKHILIREDGWSLGSSSDMLEKAENLWPDQWLGRVDLVGQNSVEFQARSTHGYWVLMGAIDIETGEPCALKTEIADQERATPKGKTLEDLREFLRKGMS